MRPGQTKSWRAGQRPGGEFRRDLLLGKMETGLSEATCEPDAAPACYRFHRIRIGCSPAPHTSLLSALPSTLSPTIPSSFLAHCLWRADSTAVSLLPKKEDPAYGRDAQTVNYTASQANSMGCRRSGQHLAEVQVSLGALQGQPGPERVTSDVVKTLPGMADWFTRALLVSRGESWFPGEAARNSRTTPLILGTRACDNFSHL